MYKDVTFPNDYGVSELDGKTTTFLFTNVGNGYYVEVTPENITDEFVEHYFSAEYGIKTVTELWNLLEQDYLYRYGNNSAN